MRLRRAIWLLLPLSYVMACGGRFEKTVAGDDQAGGGSSPTTGATSSSGGSGPSTAGSSSRAGSSSKAGSSSRGGSSGKAGSASVGGSVAVGGTTSIAGSVGIAGVGGVCLCTDPGCALPFRPVQNAAGCCEHCELDLMACAAAEQRYQQFRAQVIAKYQTLSCMIDSDCGLFFDKNECGAASCGAALLNSEIMSVTQNLNSYAQANCSFACPPQPTPPCLPRPAPTCVMSHCQ